MSDYPVEDFCSTCGHYEQTRMGDKGQYICLACDEEQQLFQALKNAARKRPPTKKPQDGEVVLVQDVWNDLVLAIFSGENFEDKHSTVIADHSIRHWWPIKHLLKSDK